MRTGSTSTRMSGRRRLVVERDARAAQHGLARLDGVAQDLRQRHLHPLERDLAARDA
jgi:hypothetical protein